MNRSSREIFAQRLHLSRPAMWRFLGWCLSFVILLGFGKVARADGTSTLQDIHVCARPGNVPEDADRWAITLGGTVLIGPQAEARDKKSGIIRYVFDPNAPAESVKLLPIPYNKLKCAERILPHAVPVLPSASTPSVEEPEKAKKEAPKAAEKEAATPESSATPLVAPLLLPKPVAKPPPPEPPRLPNNGVTTDWSKSVLPMAQRSQRSANGRALLECGKERWT